MKGQPGSSSPVTIRRIRPDEAPQLRDLRLRALADAPEAFGSTLAEMLAQPASFWERRVERASHGSEQSLFVAVAADECVGLAGGVIEPERPLTVEVISMWVDPAVRRRGVARRLLQAVVDWGCEQGAAQSVLWVTQTNTAAQALYRAMAFEPTGRTQPLPSHPWLSEMEMSKCS